MPAIAVFLIAFLHHPHPDVSRLPRRPRDSGSGQPAWRVRRLTQDGTTGALKPARDRVLSGARPCSGQRGRRW